MWRLLCELERLWAKVIRSRYGGLEESRSLSENGRGKMSVSLWWRDLCGLFWGSNGDGLRGDFVRILGRGDDTLFWQYVWVGGEFLCVKFPRLFSLSGQKSCKISEMGSWVCNSWEWNFTWSRNLSARNLDLIDMLLTCIGNCKPSYAGRDVWRWNPAPNGVYSTSVSYDFFRQRKEVMHPLSDQEVRVYKKLWHSCSPRKTISSAWRLVKNRLPTLDNLLHRGVAVPELICKLCQVDDECATHLFFTCNVSSQIWSVIFSWLGISLVLHLNPQINLLVFSNCLGGRKLKKVVATIWIGVI